MLKIIKIKVINNYYLFIKVQGIKISNKRIRQQIAIIVPKNSSYNNRSNKIPKSMTFKSFCQKQA